MGSRWRAAVVVALACLAGGVASADSTVLWGSSSALIDGTRAVGAGQYRRGARRLEEALRAPLPPHERSVALANLCAAYAGLGFRDAAVRRCSDAIAADATNWRSYSNRGAALLARGSYADAVADFRAALRLEPAAEPAVLGLQLALARHPSPVGERDI